MGERSERLASATGGVTPSLDGTFYQRARTEALWACAENGDLSGLRAALDRGAVIDAPDTGGDTPLLIAISFDHPVIVAELLARGASTAVVAKYGESLIVAATRRRSVEMLDMLASAGAPLDGWASSALVLAVRKGFNDCVAWLLDHDADPNAVDDFGTSVLSVAVRNGETSLVEMLTRAGANPDCGGRASPFALACAAGRLALLEHFFDAGAEIGRDLGDGTTPLHVAAGEGQTEVVRWLLEHGADPRADACGWTPLHEAAGGGHGSTLALLLHRGGDPTAVDRQYGWNPRTQALASGHDAAAVQLLAAGAPAQPEFEADIAARRV